MTANQAADLVTRLRHWSREDDADIGHEAADEIERLRRAIDTYVTARDGGESQKGWRQLQEIAKESAADVPVVQKAPPIARCTKCSRVVNNTMAGQRCLMEFADGSLCDGTLFTVL